MRSERGTDTQKAKRTDEQTDRERDMASRDKGQANEDAQNLTRPKCGQFNCFVFNTLTTGYIDFKCNELAKGKRTIELAYLLSSIP